MAWNPYIGQPREWLEARLREAQAEEAAGKSTNSVGAGDVSTGKIVHKSPAERIADLLKALNAIDPDAYPSGCWLRNTTTRVQLRSIAGPGGSVTYPYFPPSPI